MWQPFTEEHQQFRKTVRAFAEKELAPHAEEWEEPTSSSRTGSSSARVSSASSARTSPRSTAARGLDYWFSVAKAEELPHSRAPAA
jgi:citronellyl-CoA dehydrogenase